MPMLKPASVISRGAALASSAVSVPGAGCTISFHAFSSGRKVTQGLRISTKENPGCLIACASTSADWLGSPEKQRAMKFALEAGATTSGWNGATPVPPGDSAVSNSGSVVGEDGPLVMP